MKKVTITSILLKSPFHFFPLSLYALNIVRQISKAEGHLDFKKRGIWTLHYTMTLWENEAALKEFAYSGAHQEAMKKGAKVAKQIRTLTYSADKLPDWKTAKERLEKEGRIFNY